VFALLLGHAGRHPSIDSTAYVAPNALVCGDVRIGAGCRIMFGVQIVAEGGCIEIGAESIVLENAVLRSTFRHPLSVGRNCLIGPHAHIVGCRLEDEVFIATGASVFHGAHIGKGAEVRINAIVHLRTELDAGATVPIGWVAVGNPADILPPDQHAAIWAAQEPLNFPLTVYGIDRGEADMVKITQRMVELLGTHHDDAVGQEAAP
jgi:carbonic anhydrase/acetyltransferase-like protein (isoleucine patch superfamily)